MGREGVFHDDPPRLGDAQPQPPGAERVRAVGVADARPERAVRAVGRRVRVRAEDERTGGRKPLLREDVVADAGAGGEEVLDALFAHPRLDLVQVVGDEAALRGDVVVEDDDVAVGVSDPVEAEFGQPVHHRVRREVVGEDPVGRHGDVFAR